MGIRIKNLLSAKKQMTVAHYFVACLAVFARV
jgi:hypothetical protein